MDVVQRGGEGDFLPTLAVERDGEAVCLVTNALD